MSKFGFRTKEERELVRWARANGWEVVGRNGNNHIELRDIGTGTVSRIPGKMPGGRKHSALAQLNRFIPFIAALGFNPLTGKPWGDI